GAAAADGRRARFVVTPERWGRRQIGTLEVTLRDRWRLAEGRVSMPLPRIDCYPAPARQRTRVVLRRLPNRPRQPPAPAPPPGPRLGPPGRASSSPACASTGRATGSAASTGRPAPGAAGCR